MAQRTRKVLLWDGSYTKDGDFGACNAENTAAIEPTPPVLHTTVGVGTVVVAPKIGVRIVRVDRFLDIDRDGRKVKSYGRIVVDLKGISAIQSLLLVVYPRAGAGRRAAPIYREVISGNDKIVKLLRAPTRPGDTEDPVPPAPSKVVEAWYRDCPYTVRVWVSTAETIDVDALRLSELPFLDTHVLPAEVDYPTLIDDKALPHVSRYRAKRRSYEHKEREVGHNKLGRNLMSAPLHKELSLAFIQTTHTIALPPLDRSDPGIAERLEAHVAPKKEAMRAQVEEAKQNLAELEERLVGLKQQRAEADAEVKRLREEHGAEIAALEKSRGEAVSRQKLLTAAEGDPATLEQQRTEVAGEIAALNKRLKELQGPLNAKIAEAKELEDASISTNDDIGFIGPISRQDPEQLAAQTPDQDYYTAYPDEYKRMVKEYLDGLEDLSFARFDYRLLRRVPATLNCPTCALGGDMTAQNMVFCQHSLELELFPQGSDTGTPCPITALTSKGKQGPVNVNNKNDTIGSGGTTRTNFDNFMGVFCAEGEGALAPIPGTLITITDDNYAHNVAAALAYKTLIQAKGPGPKRLVLNYDQHFDCGDHAMELDADNEVKITCATWGQFVYYESPPPGGPALQPPSSSSSEPSSSGPPGLPPPPGPLSLGPKPKAKSKLQTPYAPTGLPIAHGYVAIGTLTILPDKALEQLEDYRLVEGALPDSAAAWHELEVNPAAAKLRRRDPDAEPGKALTTTIFGQKTFKGSRPLYQKCDYKDLFMGANVENDVGPDGVQRVYFCPNYMLGKHPPPTESDSTPDGGGLTPDEEDPKTLRCSKCGLVESRKGIEDVYHDGPGGDWSAWHVFITVDRDFFIGNGTGWNDGRNSSHKGRKLVLESMKYLRDKKATIVGFDMCGVPDKKGIGLSKFLGPGRPYADVYGQLADDLRTFAVQMDEIMYAAEEGRATQLLTCDPTWTVETWRDSLDDAPPQGSSSSSSGSSPSQQPPPPSSSLPGPSSSAPVTPPVEQRCFLCQNTNVGELAPFKCSLDTCGKVFHVCRVPRPCIQQYFALRDTPVGRQNLCPEHQ